MPWMSKEDLAAGRRLRGTARWVNWVWKNIDALMDMAEQQAGNTPAPDAQQQLLVESPEAVELKQLKRKVAAAIDHHQAAAEHFVRSSTADTMREILERKP
jgi:hypothetical protein